jgi:hypothetical protein
MKSTSSLVLIGRATMSLSIGGAFAQDDPGYSGPDYWPTKQRALAEQMASGQAAAQAATLKAAVDQAVAARFDDIRTMARADRPGRIAAGIGKNPSPLQAGAADRTDFGRCRRTA